MKIQYTIFHLLHTAYSLSTAGLASTTSNTNDEKSITKIDTEDPVMFDYPFRLEWYDSTATPARKHVKGCMSYRETGAVIFQSLTSLCSIGLSAAAYVKETSNHHRCASNDVTYFDNLSEGKRVWMKLTTSGKNCDTTAQKETIAGALDDAFKTASSKGASWICVRLDHGGTWSAEIAVGINEYEVRNRNCYDGEANQICISAGQEKVC